MYIFAKVCMFNTLSICECEVIIEATSTEQLYFSEKSLNVDKKVAK